MMYVVAYGVSLLAFAALDAVWLSTMGAALYRATLGDLLADKVRLLPAILFYLAYPVGIAVFAVMPALRAESLVPAVGYGLLFGALAYATYDLTNFATLRVWSVQITVVDIVYGAVASAVTAVLAFLATRAVSGWLAGAS